VIEASAGSTLCAKVLPDAGHLCNMEAPEEFNQALRAFLRGIPP
jgi:pimeloyl-ACP methyl ester carboxylesterase